MRVAALGFAAVTLLSACSSAEPAETASTTSSSTTTSTSTTTTTSTSVAPTVTVIETVPAPNLQSEGHVRVGSTDYALSFECFAAGAGDVLAVGVGADPDSSGTVEAVVQAFFGQPYVGVLFGDGGVIELDVDRQAELFVQDGVIRGTALRFVRSDTSPGDGDELGLGSVLVECVDFVFGLPEGYELIEG